MNLGSYPLIAWGAAEAIGGGTWTTGAGSITPTTGQTDPFGGTNAVRLDDTSGVTVSYRYGPAAVINATRVVVQVFVKQGTGVSSMIKLRDTTAGADRVFGSAVWNAGSPTMFEFTGGTPLDGNSTTPALAVGGGWFLCRFLSSAITPGNTHRLELYPTDNAGASTGTSTFHVQHAVLLDVPSDYRRFARPREGYETAVTPSGSRDAWTYGDEWVRSMRQSWIPATARDWPVGVSGYRGEAPLTGVDGGVEAMLRTGWQMNALRWVPDRSACSTYQDVYLAAPTRDWTPDAEGNGDTALDLELVSASAPGVVA